MNTLHSVCFPSLFPSFTPELHVSRETSENARLSASHQSLVVGGNYRRFGFDLAELFFFFTRAALSWREAERAYGNGAFYCI